MYLNKFTASFPDEDTVLEWASLWGENLSGMNGEQIKFGLTYCSQNHEWPPTMGEFRSACQARPQPYVALPAPIPMDVEKGKVMSARIKSMISGQRQPGKWWAEQILAKDQSGDVVNDAVLRMAREALAPRETPHALPQGAEPTA